MEKTSNNCEKMVVEPPDGDGAIKIWRAMTQENCEPVDRMGYPILGQTHIWLK